MRRCENCSGITVTSIFSHLYGQVLQTLIEEENKERQVEEQCGFRAGRSCMGNIFCLKTNDRKLPTRREFSPALYRCEKKTHDTDITVGLWGALTQARINYTMIKAVKELYKNSKAK